VKSDSYRSTPDRLKAGLQTFLSAESRQVRQECLTCRIFFPDCVTRKHSDFIKKTICKIVQAWIPAFAGMTAEKDKRPNLHQAE